MDAVSSLLLAAATHEPLVLVLEDLHAVDTDSLSLLEFAARQLHGARALIIGSFRDAEIHRPRIGNIVARLRRDRHPTTACDGSIATRFASTCA